MTKKYWGSLCVTDIDKGKIISHENGKKYLPIEVFVDDVRDKYGNSISVKMKDVKNEDGSYTKGAYLGNLKFDRAFGEPSAATQPQAASVVEQDDPELPF